MWCGRFESHERCGQSVDVASVHRVPKTIGNCGPANPKPVRPIQRRELKLCRKSVLGVEDNITCAQCVSAAAGKGRAYDNVIYTVAIYVACRSDANTKAEDRINLAVDLEAIRSIESGNLNLRGETPGSAEDNVAGS